MSYECENCRQTTTLGNILNTVLKVGAIAGIAYIAINFKSEIKSAVQSVLKKRTGGEISGTENNEPVNARQKKSKSKLAA